LNQPQAVAQYLIDQGHRFDYEVPR
jgi:hypothetical protein